jgi:hypothetical protein
MTLKDPNACSKGKVVALARAVVAQSGGGGSAAQFVATSDGSASAPAFRGTDADIGISFNPGPLGNVDISVSGVVRLTVGATAVGIAAGNPLAINENYLEGGEIADPSAPSSNYGRLYFRDNGAGKTQLVARFPTGAIQVIATEP